MKIIHKNQYKNLYDVPVWRNPYNQNKEVDPLFASHFIVAYKDDSYEDKSIEWENVNGFYLLGNKKNMIDKFNTLQEYMINHIELEEAIPYRFTLFQSFSIDAALIIGDGTYESLDEKFSDIFSLSHHHLFDKQNLHPIEIILNYQTEETLHLHFVEHIISYRNFFKR